MTWRYGWLLLLVALAAADLALGSGNVSGIFTMVPLVCAAGVSWRETAVSGLVTFVLALLLVLRDSAGSEPAVVRLGAVALAALIAVRVATLRERREARVARLARVAEVSQNVILAALPPAVGPFAVASAYRSASDEASVGGDLLDMVETDSGTHLIVGDVRGKGIEAVRTAAATMRSFRDAVLTGASPHDVFAAVERRLQAELGLEDFVTAVWASFPLDGSLRLFNCAHPPPLLVRAGRSCLLEPPEPTTPFGLAPAPVPLELALRPGDRLLFYTDGLIETRARDGAFVPLDTVADQLATDPWDDALDNLLRRLREAAGGRLSDDLAVVLLEYRP